MAQHTQIQIRENVIFRRRKVSSREIASLGNVHDIVLWFKRHVKET